MEAKAVIADKGVLTMVQSGRSAMMHYVKSENGVKSLTLGNSGKVADLLVDNKVQLQLEKNGALVDAEVSIITDKDKVKSVFDAMLSMNSTHFKEYTEDIVILDMQLA